MSKLGLAVTKSCVQRAQLGLGVHIMALGNAVYKSRRRSKGSGVDLDERVEEGGCILDIWLGVRTQAEQRVKNFWEEREECLAAGLRDVVQGLRTELDLVPLRHR